MIEELHLQSLGVIEDAVVEFSPGLTVVTGETGAGKTMVVTGLGLLLGARADATQIRQDAPRALIEGRIHVAPDGMLADRIQAAGGALDDDVVVLVRTVTPQGRSRAHVGGASAPVGVLTDLAGDLVALHGQSDQQRLLQPTRQREVLDAFAGLGSVLQEYRATHEEFVATRNQLRTLVEQRQERLQEADLLRFGINEIDAVNPSIGEVEQLVETELRLSHADELFTAAASARSVLQTDDAAGVADQPVAVTELLARARKVLESVSEHDPLLAKLSERLAEVGFL
ncbi:MAG TPA: AAA family ATPase, partial [Actinomycetes bacterium]|nr:AAA family ATPase [Actinomycetes bacterium]